VTLVDTNILLDFITEDRVWFEPSRNAFIMRAAVGPMLIVDAVFAETSIAFPNAAACSRFVDMLGLEHVPMSRDALWLAGRAYKLYRSRGGTRTNVLADFFVGAMAASERLAVLTRDPSHYATYFPDVPVPTPARDLRNP
jgi:predicted nucleic acid-binding protein